MEDGRVKTDVIVVGGGPAGLMAAHRLAQEGLEVILMERGAYAGSKNVSGLLYATVLSEAIPDFEQRAPLERPVTRRSFGFLDDEVFSYLTFGSRDWASPPFNRTWVVYRAHFDRWLAKEVEEAGATVLEETVVDDLLYDGEGENRRVIGVRIRGEEEPFFADTVILAEGALGIVTRKALETLGGMSQTPQVYGIGVKEIWGLPSGVIEDRFHLESGQGAALEWIGSPFKGLVGGGFLYTGKESLALGFIAKVDSLIAAGIAPYDLMESIKAHPEIGRYLAGGELLEYSAHILPEGGLRALPKLSHHGLLIVGDAAGFVNASFYHEGANLAMASGRMAAEAVIQAKLIGDFSRGALSLYERMLSNSFVMEDLRHFRRVPEAQKVFPRLMDVLPARFCRLLVDLYQQSTEPKRVQQREAFRKMMEGIPKLRTIKDLWKLKGMIG